MKFFSLIRFFEQRRNSKRANRLVSSRVPSDQRLHLEPLEDRTLLSSNYVVNRPGDAGIGGNGTTAAGQLSGDIRYVISETNKVANAGSTITFNTALTGPTITLTNNELQISDTTTILGPGAGALTISGNNTVRVFDITHQNAVVIITGLTITKGNASPANIGSPGNQGGDIFNSGQLLTLSGDIVSGGLASGISAGLSGRGGAIFNAASRFNCRRHVRHGQHRGWSNRRLGSGRRHLQRHDGRSRRSE